MLPNPVLPSWHIFGPLEIHPFGVLVAIGIIVGTHVAGKRAKVLGYDPTVISDVAMWAVVPGFIGAHLVAVLFYKTDKLLADPWLLLRIWEDISSIGGFMGGFAGVLYFFLRRRKVPIWPYIEALTYGFAVAWIFGRLGCTVAFDHPGTATDFFLGMKYPDDRTLSGVVRHNLGFYEALWAMAVSLLFFTQRNRPRFSGWYFATFFMAYFPLRFVADFWRVEDKLYWGLTPGQYLCFPLFAAAVWIYAKRRKVGEILTPGSEPAAATASEGKLKKKRA